MTLVLNLPPEIEARLNERAKAAGKDVSVYANELILDGLDQPRTFAEILKPVHATSQFKHVSDEEFDSFINDVRDAVRRDANASDDALNQFTNDLIDQTRVDRRP